MPSSNPIQQLVRGIQALNLSISPPIKSANPGSMPARASERATPLTTPPRMVRRNSGIHELPTTPPNSVDNAGSRAARESPSTNPSTSPVKMPQRMELGKPAQVESDEAIVNKTTTTESSQSTTVHRDTATQGSMYLHTANHVEGTSTTAPIEVIAPHHIGPVEAAEIERVRSQIKLLVGMVEVLSVCTPRLHIKDIRPYIPSTPVSYPVFVVSELQELSAPWDPEAKSLHRDDRDIVMQGAKYDQLCHLTALIGMKVLGNLFNNDAYVEAIHLMTFDPEPRFQLRREHTKDQVSTIMHDVLHLKTVTGRHFVVDVTGKQFGFEEWWSSYEEYDGNGFIVPDTYEEREIDTVLLEHEFNAMAGCRASAHLYKLYNFAVSSFDKIEESLGLEGKSIRELPQQEQEAAFERVGLCLQETLEEEYRDLYVEGYFE